jgi:glycolate oxidase iron-sulfur subunit
MRALVDGRLEASRLFAEEMYFCLGCLACMSACPAGVNYAELFEQARADVESRRLLNGVWRQAIRRLTVGWLFMEPQRLDWLGRALRLYQQLGWQRVLRASGCLRLLPKRWQELESMTPQICRAFSSDLIPRRWPPSGPVRHRVALLMGCVQDLIYSDVNLDTAEVLARNGCEVITVPDQPCCGSLHAHHGAWEQAKQLARRLLDAVPPEDYDAIISNAGGCGSHLKHYRVLLKHEPHYVQRAALWDRKVKDVHEWLIEIGAEAPVGAPRRTERVTYHESCHLAHGQGISRQPREVLRRVPGLELVELPECQWCCGSAGIYNLVQPQMAGELLARKLDHIQSVGVSVVATANPGCLLQLQNGARARGWSLRVAHPVSLLAEAYRKTTERPPL